SDSPEMIHIPEGETFVFGLTGDHLTLLKAAQYHGLWIDPKRPYGDMSYYELDIARLLGIPTARDGNRKPVFPAGEERRMRRLHHETLFALTAFLQHAALEPGVFVRR